MSELAWAIGLIITEILLLPSKDRPDECMITFDDGRKVSIQAMADPVRDAYLQIT